MNACTNNFSISRTLDPDSTGHIPHLKLMQALTTRGQKLPRETVKILLDNPRYNSEGQFDYKGFTNDVFDTSSKLTEAIKERFGDDHSASPLKTGTYKVCNKSEITRYSAILLSDGRENGKINVTHLNFWDLRLALVKLKQGACLVFKV